MEIGEKSIYRFECYNKNDGNPQTLDSHDKKKTY